MQLIPDVIYRFKRSFTSVSVYMPFKKISGWRCKSFWIASRMSRGNSLVPAVYPVSGASMASIHQDKMKKTFLLSAAPILSISESGGPWAKLEDGMKNLIWTEINVKGGTSKIVLPKPQGVTGSFQNLPMPFYQANSKLLPSGLLGPVRVVALTKR